MKKTILLIFALVMAFAMVSCSKVEDKKEKEETSVKVDKTEAKLSKTTEKVEEKTTVQSTTTSKKEEAEVKGFAAGIDKNLDGHELLKACEAAFVNSPFAKGKSVHMKMKNISSDGSGGTRENTIEMYFSADGKKERMENITLNSEENTLSIMNYEDGVMYMVYGNGTGMKFPLGDEDDDVTSDMTGDDPTINPASGEGFFDEGMGDLVVARLEEYKGETALYIEYMHTDAGLSKAWYSLDNAIPLKTQVLKGDKITYESETIEFETGGNYDDMFKEPEGITWQELPNMGDLDSIKLPGSE